MRDNVILRRLFARRPNPRWAWIAAAAVCLSLLGAACGGSSGHHHATVPTTSTGPLVRPATARPPLISIFEVPELASDPAGILDQLRALGVDYVRVNVAWASVAPDPTGARPPAGFDATSPAAYPPSGWAPYDAIVSAAAAHGIGVILDPFPPAPQWATGRGEPAGGLPGLWKPRADLFGQFVQALATRYSGHYRPAGGAAPLPRVSWWEVWNEPNYGSDLAPQAIDHSKVEYSPLAYRQMLDAAWAAFGRSGHGRDTILIGDLAPSGITGPGYPGNFSGMVPLRFLRALYCLDGGLHPLAGAAAAERGCPTTAAASRRFPSQHPALFRASGFAVHPYSQGVLAPNLPTPNEPDYTNLAVLAHLGQTLDRIQAIYGSSTRFPIYSTEYGYKTNPPYVAGAPLDIAAGYLNWAEYLSWLDPRIRSFDQYLLTDPSPAGHSRFDTGLEFYGGKPKPSLAAFRLPIWIPQTSGHRGTPLEVWGCVRPARFAPGASADVAQIEFAATAAGPFHRITTATISSQDCSFDLRVRFPSSGFVRLTWSYPSGETIHSRVVAVTLT
jgi:hypothetical protein